jgi:hypothetical protein
VALIDADVDVGTEAFEKYVHFLYSSYLAMLLW